MTVMDKSQKKAYVLLGRDSGYKKIQTDRLKSSFQKQSAQINPVYFFSQGLSLYEIQKEIENLSFTLRLFIFKDSQALSEPIKSYLTKLLKRKPRDYFIFDFNVETKAREKLEEDDFFAFLFAYNPPFKIAGGSREVSLRDLASALRKNSAQDSLLIMNNLLKQYRPEKISMQILGLLVKMFTQATNPYLKERYIRYLLEADRLIKEGRLSAQLALDILILKMQAGGSVPQR